MDSPLVVQVKEAAKLNGVDPALACAVAEQESGWNVWAYRYEPAFYRRYVVPLNLPISEAIARGTSWGLFQVMGQVARERGFTQKFLSSLCDPDFGIPVGIQFLKHCLDISAADQTKALLRWNGGSNPNYAAEVLARVSKYQEERTATA